jgi:hypothetical protein
MQMGNNCLVPNTFKKWENLEWKQRVYIYYKVVKAQTSNMV